MLQLDLLGILFRCPEFNFIFFLNLAVVKAATFKPHYIESSALKSSQGFILVFPQFRPFHNYLPKHLANWSITQECMETNLLGELGYPKWSNLKVYIYFMIYTIIKWPSIIWNWNRKCLELGWVQISIWSHLGKISIYQISHCHRCSCISPSYQYALLNNGWRSWYRCRLVYRCSLV